MIGKVINVFYTLLFLGCSGFIGHGLYQKFQIETLRAISKPRASLHKFTKKLTNGPKRDVNRL